MRQQRQSTLGTILPVCIGLLGCSLFLEAQAQNAERTVHHVPFGSSGNVIELIVTNDSPIAGRDLSVEITDLPGWITLRENRLSVPLVQPHGGEAVVRFSFSVDRSAPTAAAASVRAVVKTADGNTSWENTMWITVDAPTRFELFQNYPNPFNPATSIQYTLAERTPVRLVVFDVLGREVAILVDGESQDAGFHDVRWDAASGLPSGVYFYRLAASSFVETKQMMVLR